MPSSPSPSPISTSLFHRIALLAFAIGLIIFCIPLVMDWRQPLIGLHDFRQAQTAISVYYMLKGGPLLGYETPVLGAPWTIPFEFPLYQWVVALTYKLLPLSLDQAGRLVSWSAFLLMLWPLRVIVKRLGGDSTLFYLLAAMLLCSPVYAYWSHTFMIESTALLLSVGFIALLLVYLDRPAFFTLVMVTVLASLAALVKITTFVAFAAAGGLLVLRDFHLRHRTIAWKTLALRYSGLAVAVAISLILTILWIHYGDNLKSRSVIGSALTSSHVASWTRGTWSQLLSSELWKRIGWRMLPEILGINGLGWLFCFLLMLGYIFSKKAYGIAWLALGLVALFFLPIVIFTNLHFVHNYYQFENALFLIAATVFVLWQLQKLAPPFIALYALGIILAFEILSSLGWYPMLKADKTLAPQYQLAAFIQTHTLEDSVFIGLGLDWSPVIPYYSQRRAVLLPVWLSPSMLATILHSPLSVTGGLPVAAFVDCPHPQLLEESHIRVLVEILEQNMTADMKMQTVKGCKVFMRQ